MKKVKPKRRSRRRGDEERMKDRVRHYDVVRAWDWADKPRTEPDERVVGIVAESRRRCSCFTCRPPRYDRGEAKRAAARDLREAG